MSGEFLPVTMEECRERGIEQPDFVYVCGDAYVDHSSFGAAIICRLLESRGLFGGNDSSAGLERSGKHPGVW